MTDGNNDWNNTIFSIGTNKKLSLNQWHYVVFTWDGTTNPNGIKIYVDDTSKPDITTTARRTETHAQTYNLTIGTSYGKLLPFVGDLDQMEIFSDANAMYDLLEDTPRGIFNTSDGLHLQNSGFTILPESQFQDTVQNTTKGLTIIPYGTGFPNPVVIDYTIPINDINFNMNANNSMLYRVQSTDASKAFGSNIYVFPTTDKYVLYDKYVALKQITFSSPVTDILIDADYTGSMLIVGLSVDGGITWDFKDMTEIQDTILTIPETTKLDVRFFMAYDTYLNGYGLGWI
jgi:hypothetical protein